MKGKSLATAAALFLSITAVAPTTEANGRFPGANHLVFGPSDAARIAVRTTFGALLSRDGGATFRWVCEEAVGYAGQQDPAIALFEDGTLATAALEGAFVSHDAGCSHQRLVADTSVDFTVARSEPSRGLLITSTFVKGVHEARVLLTVDSGHSFSRLSLFDEGFYPDTIDIAPSAPTRAYVSGTFSDGQKLQGAVDRSDDGGVTWKRQVFDLQGDSGVYLAAVDPQNPDRVYVRTTGKAADRLLASDDAGATFAVRATVPGGLLGFALSPDGTQVAIGGPSVGVQTATRDALVFTTVNAVPVNCLAWAEPGLFACGAGAEAGFALARSTDGGTTFSAVLPSLAAICGPLDDCSASSGFAATCAPRWPAIAANFGGDGSDTCGQVGAAGAGGGGAGAAGSTDGNAGTTSAGAAGAAGQGDPPPAAASPGSSGGCTASTGGSASALALTTALGALLAMRARRRGDRKLN
jgi:hypothetical protein